MKHLGLLRRGIIAGAIGALLLGGLATATPASAAVTTLVSGQAVTASINAGGEPVSYFFNAQVGQHVTFSTSTSTWNGAGSAGMFLYTPAGPGNSYILADHWVAATGKTALYDFTPNLNGVWKIMVAPATPVTAGSTTFTYATDVDKGTLAVNTAVTAATTVPGQNVVTYFNATAASKAHISLDITASNWGTGGTANGYLYTPSGVLADVVPLAGTPTFYDFTPTLDGHWKFVIDPNASAVGTLSLTLAADQNKGQLQTNTPVSTTITNKGSQAFFGVSGVANQELPIKVSATNWGTTGSAYLFLFPANSNTLVGFCALKNAAVTCPFYPSATGAYRLVLDPEAGAVGSATIQRTT